MAKKCTSFIEYKGSKTSALSWTEDMACWSFSLPAGYSCPMAKYGENTICSSCYAQINRYNMPSVLRSQFIRFEYVKHMLGTKSRREKFTAEMIEIIDKHVKNGYFRWFDSGDLFSPKLVDVCANICDALPHIQFWFPTRNWNHTKELPESWTIALGRLSNLDNVMVRPSAIHFNDEAPEVDYLNLGSTSHTIQGSQPEDHCECPKTLNGGTCESNTCRSCWEPDKKISYLVHGFLGRHKPANARSDKIVNTRDRIKTNVLTELTVGVS